ncbi:hypothetical protein DYB32_004237 [Aphanomyces invadans]|uniref:Uncharacterized protein n=1 Tax=Aphanomyces invadans TaxID=157072 RepID=A0A3R6WMQ2_9STRA|nr:hypothetical protein DYB32_004237 [Aphanomyces invadans]
MPASVEAQRQEIWTALHSTLFQPSLGANLSLATLKESVVLFPSSNARDPITIGTTPAYSSLQRQPYVTLRLAATCHIDNLTLDATTATSRPCNGIDAQFLAFALFDTFDGHLALRPHTFIVHAPVSIRSEVYRMASSVFVVDVAAAVDRTHTLVHQFLQQSMGQLRSHLSQSNMSSRSDVRMAMNDDAVAAIVSSSRVTHWTFYTPPDLMLDTLQVCLYLEQVQSVSPTTDESRAAVVVCVESVQGAAVHVSIQIAQPHRLAASHSIVGLNVVVLTLSNAVATTDPTHAVHSTYVADTVR